MNYLEYAYSMMLKAKANGEMVRRSKIPNNPIHTKFHAESTGCNGGCANTCSNGCEDSCTGCHDIYIGSCTDVPEHALLQGAENTIYDNQQD